METAVSFVINWNVVIAAAAVYLVAGFIVPFVHGLVFWSKVKPLPYSKAKIIRQTFFRALLIAPLLPVSAILITIDNFNTYKSKAKSKKFRASNLKTNNATL